MHIVTDKNGDELSMSTSSSSASSNASDDLVLIEPGGGGDAEGGMMTTSPLPSVTAGGGESVVRLQVFETESEMYEDAAGAGATEAGDAAEGYTTTYYEGEGLSGIGEEGERSHSIDSDNDHDDDLVILEEMDALDATPGYFAD